MYTASFQRTFSAVQCVFSALRYTEAYPELCSVYTEVSLVSVYTPAYCSVFSVCTEDFKQSTFSAALQVPWNSMGEIQGSQV